MVSKVTMQDIADNLGISKVSVSKVINNQPGIGDKMRQQILEKAQELGYVKAPRISSIGKQTLKFAIISSKRFFCVEEAFYTNIYYYLNKRCIEKGYSVSTFIMDESEETAVKIPPQLTKENFDGIFILGEISPSMTEKIQKLNGAKMTVDFFKQNSNMDSVIIDNFSIGTEVTNYLIEKGHRKIGFVGNIHHTTNICDRYFGYQKALALAGLPYMEEWNLINNSEENEYTLEVDLPSDMPTAFVCHCDKAAFFLMRSLKKNGIKIPSEVSLVSFDNTSICELATPTLTSVKIDCKELAMTSFEQMMYRVDHMEMSPQKIILSCKLIERNSVVQV